MNTNLDRYKPVKYLVFTTNALRNNIGDGTLDYYKRYKSPNSSYFKIENEPFNSDHPKFFYCDQFTVRRCALDDEIIQKAKSALGNLAVKQRKNSFYREEIILLLNCDDENEFSLDVIYLDINTKKWVKEPFEDLAYDSDITDQQRKYIMNKLTNFYNARVENQNAKTVDLQDEYLTYG